MRTGEESESEKECMFSFSSYVTDYMIKIYCLNMLPIKFYSKLHFKAKQSLKKSSGVFES